MTIRKKAGLAVLAAALFAAAALLAWRLWPHSLENITQIDSSRYTGVSAVLLADDDDMIPGGDFYSLPRSREHLEPILKLLEGTGYRQDFRNLLPWPVTLVNLNDGDSASIRLVCGETGEDVSLSADGGGMMLLPAEDGFRIYHLTDKSVSVKLAAYLKQNGQFQGE